MREYLLVFLVAATVSYLLTVVAREVAVRVGAVARVRDRDVHAEPIPYFGGVAMLGGIVAAYFVARQLPFLSFRGSDEMFRDAGVVVIAGAAICLLGVFDDIFEIDPLMKFGGQVLVAGFLVVQNVQFFFFQVPGGAVVAIDPLQGATLTVLVVVVTVNAVNFVDGLDGLAAGIVGIGALAFFVFCYQLTNINDETLATTGALLSAMLAGACVGFLGHNHHPARLFMGDSGSMLLGLMLAASAITLTGQFPATQLSSGGDGGSASLLPTLLPVLLPVSILIVPLTDLALAVVRRTSRGTSPFAADKEHLHHRLLVFGHSHGRAVVIMWLWAALVGFGTVVLSLYSRPIVAVVVAAMAVVTVCLTFLVRKTAEEEGERLEDAV
ncbi:undecaprenyl/decaprenyl-phosphate alpha-N-acetylglucosaminyl 1-phosphate transferase [Nocardioides sp. ChNu-153]|uniref:MraY family glycosyltransferase n=1 Tax=unclassified Nocardioides TaxID=2615069 RepID=UPI002404A666|nr:MULTISPECIES: MraY family glycosyltransferase [unclassified Nocardioides]MDF9715468.1 undecaprenyl/decaprenyl-phosphate alpha-N-acetylglucosaminyl 1-phosphate transferase [Nocardioides sp. ChNu-99]MDN7120631.1 undecaprenyl/decaprenyl-phosphate alpha-N-acetylglucosaminyl 1-phosphate transferase [Nocardioides sp. ChNu-153]